MHQWANIGILAREGCDCCGGEKAFLIENDKVILLCPVCDIFNPNNVEIKLIQESPQEFIRKKFYEKK